MVGLDLQVSLFISIQFCPKILKNFKTQSTSNVMKTKTFKWNLNLCFILVGLVFFGCSTNEWIVLFDGKTLDGWKVSGNESSWQITDNVLVAKGAESYLFYDGEISKHDFKNFVFSVDVKTENNSTSSIYFHTGYLEKGLPQKGYECEADNSSPVDSVPDWVKTGSLTDVRNLSRSPVNDGEWFNYRIIVRGKTIGTYINDQLIVDYTEPENPFRIESEKERKLSSGTFALRCSDSTGTVYFKNIKVRPLPDNEKTPGEPVADIEFENKLIQHIGKHLPLIDFHVHLKNGLTMEEALENARKYGFTYGIAFNCGLKMGFEKEDTLQNFISTYKRPEQTFFAMQAEGREWVNMFPEKVIKQFDYVFTDAMTWTNDNGKRMRLWIPEETEVGDPENFMDQLVDRIVKLISEEPIDIYVNATYLPDEINSKYDILWTDRRMDKVIKALADKKVAMEISARYKIPNAKFIKRAKDAGVKFTFGTNDTGPNDLGRLEYCIKMADECGLTGKDFWYPGLQRK